MKFDFLQNYVPANYNGKNYILPLRSIDGRMDFPAAIPNSANQYKDTIALKQCHYFRKVVDEFSCNKESIRLMNLPPGRVINTHTDYCFGYEDGIFRIPIPILTNENVHFLLNNKLLIMQPGTVWYTNVNFPHSVTNKGQTNRIHLVLDCIRNKWSDNLFKSIGYDFEQEKDLEEYISKETALKIIKELEFHNTSESIIIIEQLKLKHSIK